LRSPGGSALSRHDAFRLDGRVALVTGGGGGLGADMCRALATAGAAVVVAGRTRETIDAVRDQVRAEGGTAISVLADVSRKQSIDEMAATVTGELGGVDILVNNAAIYPRRAWTEIDEEEWDSVFATNLKGYFLCARACYPAMAGRGHGRIINLTSITFFGGWSMLLSYVSTKGGIVAFTRALARELGPEGITVNSISPGAFPTDAEKIHPDPEGYNTWVLEQQSIKRRGTPEDIGNLAVFLASDASSFITGQLFQIDGGWVMH
jgi:NAD(P)-dependent dehydrogenase (short-subunit alcohol dehydrogenase family)